MHGQLVSKSHGRRRFASCGAQSPKRAERGLSTFGLRAPKAIEVMREIGINISQHRSKHLNEFLNQKVETVITVCGNADQACPIFPGQINRYHWGFLDPAHAKGKCSP
jgi:arsenate reductase